MPCGDTNVGGVGRTAVEEIDPTSTAFFARDDYFDVLRTLRDEAPVHLCGPGLRTIARYDDVREVSRDPARFRSGAGALVNDPMRTSGHPGGDPDAPKSILFMDPPEHAGFRRLLNREFTPRSVTRLEARIRELARAVIERAPVGEPIDAVEQLTAPFPMLVIAELLGIPDGDRADFRRWSDATIESTDRPPEESAATFAEFHGFLVSHLETRRRDPGDDLVSLLVRGDVEGRPLSTDELIMFLLTLLVAGNETTRTLLSGGLVALADHPDQRAALAADAAGIPGAVEECLRWVTPIQAFCRTVVADTTVGGHRVEEGDYLVMLYASANRDERAFGADADRFDVTRPVNPAHLAFGFGEHLCLGASLARLEARVFLEELFARSPGYEVVGAPERVASTLIAGIRTLPVTLPG
jgi:cytochrome P450